SSRRRHTRSKRDWSSDVCSSDLSYLFHHLLIFHKKALYLNRLILYFRGSKPSHVKKLRRELNMKVRTLVINGLLAALYIAVSAQIGRASCRERGERSGVAGAVRG